VIIDATGVGYRVAQNLYNAGLRNMEQVKISAKNKIEIIGNLMNLIAHERISYPNIPELIDELANYRVTFSAHGNEQFGPAGKGSGFHDDAVVSLALAVWPLRIRQIEQPTAKQAQLIRRSLGL
jgi:phage FluMu gp28-like protein